MFVLLGNTVLVALVDSALLVGHVLLFGPAGAHGATAVRFGALHGLRFRRSCCRRSNCFKIMFRWAPVAEAAGCARLSLR